MSSLNQSNSFLATAQKEARNVQVQLFSMKNNLKDLKIIWCEDKKVDTKYWKVFIIALAELDSDT